MLKNLLKRGYFPRELPNPFETISYAELLAKTSVPPGPYSYSEKKGPSYQSRAFPYNLARRGKLRRALSVPNPVNFFHTASLVAKHWTDLETHYSKTYQSLSRPIFTKRGRAFEWQRGFDFLPAAKLRTRNGARYIVRADISNFFPSIYTHSIPWALHTKPIAKLYRDFKDNLGAKFDVVIRNGQEGQTKGIPIGPDTSFLMAEVIATSLDEALIKAIGTRYHRYVDDFEFGCTTAQESDNVLARLQEVLEEYELTLNSSKTSTIELPFGIDPLWVHELGSFNFRSTQKGQSKDLIQYFDLSIERFEENPDEPVIKFAIKKTSSLDIKPANWALYESLILQWATAEPGVLEVSIDLLKHHADLGFPIDRSKIKNVLEHIIRLHAPRGHTSELAWAIWGLILFSLPFEDEVVRILSSIENCVVALLCLDARSQKLIDPSTNFTFWESLMDEKELRGPNWLLAYEARKKNWLMPAGSTDYLKTAPAFSYLKTNDVHFYNVGRTFSYKPHKKRYWFFKKILSGYEELSRQTDEPSLRNDLSRMEGETQA